MARDPDEGTDETIIAYVRGRLPADQAERLVAEAAGRPELAADIALARGIAAAVDAEAEVAAPGQLGWARISRALDAEARGGARARPPLWQLAAAAAVAVVVWQVAAVPLLTGTGEGPGYEPVTEAPAAGFALSVAFAPDATEAAIRGLLQEVDANVSGGPTAIGLWQLNFASAEARDAGLARLSADPIVESAQVR
jgi:anti-sigma-K factor RskA